MFNPHAHGVVTGLLRTRWKRWLFLVVTGLCLVGCDGQPWNRPYPADSARDHVFYSLVQDRPTRLDPAQS